MIDFSKILTPGCIRVQRSLACALGVGFMATTTAVSAGPYDNTKTRPGTEITNIAIITYGAEISPNPIEVRHDLTVMPFDHDAALRLFREVRDSEAGQEIFIPELLRDQSLVETDRILAGINLFAVLDHPGLNFDSSAIDRVDITVSDALTGDHETLTLIETSTDSGQFVAPFCTCASAPTGGDGQIQTRPHSRIDATYQDPWRAERQLHDAVFVGPIDPFGMLFDSRTGAPLSGVEITLVDAQTGEPAQVYGADLESSYPSTLTTGSTVTDAAGIAYDLDPGEYRFPFVMPGSYRIEVLPPRGYVAPSQVPDDEMNALASGPFSLVQGSRLEPFQITAGSELEIDIPLDGSALIEVQRIGSTDSATIGDALKFTVTASTPLRGGFEADILDTLPMGLTLVPESVRINGAPGADATITGLRGRNITFDDVLIPDGGSARITYVARINAAAIEGKTLVSSSTAEAHGFIANTAHHELKIESLFRTDRSILLGQVFANGCDASYQPDLDLSGIRLLLENGRYVETDAAGLFSFRNLTPGTHVVAIDPLSLPPGFAPILCENSTRRAGRAGSVFIDATGGFADQVFLHIAAEESITLRAPRLEGEIPVQARVHDLDQAWLDAAPMRTGVVFPRPGYLPRTQSLELAVMRKPGQSVKVTLNGATLDAIHRRPAIARGDGSGYLDIWNGAPLQHGLNEVEVVIRDVRGSVVREEQVQIGFNDRVERLEYLRDRSEPTTDGYRQPLIVLRAADENGIPLHPGMRVGLSISAPFAFAGDAPQDPNSRRKMATVDPDGLIRAYLAPSRLSGTAQINALSGDKMVSVDTYISAAERPWIIVGLAEGTAAHEEISRHMVPASNHGIGKIGPLALHGRLALYAEGVIDGKWLTTLRIDTANSQTSPDFFDIDPSAQYIVYGDDSIEGDATQSRHALYLRLASERADILYGDFDTEIDEGLADYNRRLTGAHLSWRGERLEARAFAARTAQSFYSDSFAANGTSGPFDLEGENILPFSERVRVETLHRSDRERVKSERSLRRGTDYDIDYRTGRIFLAEPLRARDSELDPNVLIIDYEVETTRDAGFISGARLDYQATDTLSLGATVVHQDHVAGSNGSGQLAGIDIEKNLGNGWIARAGLAISHQSASDSLPQGASGHAAEVSITHQREDAELNAYLRSESSDFSIENQEAEGTHVVSAGIAADIVLSQTERTIEEDDTEILTHRLELSGDLEQDLDRRDRKLTFEGILRRETSAATGMISRGYGLRLDHRERRGADDDVSATALKALGLAEWTSEDGRLSLSFGQELSLAESGRNASPDTGTIEASFALTDKITLKAANEVAWGHDTHADIFSLGAEVAPWEGATLGFGALYATDGSHGATIGHAGIDQEVALSEAWTLRGGIDHQGRIDGGAEGPVAMAGLSHERIGEGFTTLTFGIDRAAEHWNAGGGIEYRLGETEDATRIHATGSGRLTEALSIGAKASLLTARSHGGGSAETDNRVEASLAWRPRDARFALLDQVIARREVSAENDVLVLTHSTYLARELEDGRQVNLRHGIKYARHGFDGESYDDILSLLGAEYRHDLSEWFDAGIHGAALTSAASRTTRGSAGLSIGITPFENGWLSLGYNFAGFRDEDFSALGYTDKGAFLQFRLKFDRESFSSFGR